MAKEKSLVYYEEMFKKLRANVPELIAFLQEFNPKAKKTLNISNSGHIFHSLYAYIPDFGKKERKVLPLHAERLEKILKANKLSYQYYDKIRSQYGYNLICPCEKLAEQLQIVQFDNDAYNQKEFNEPIVKTPRNMEIQLTMDQFNLTFRNKLKITRQKTRTRKKNTTQKLKPLDIDPRNVMKTTLLHGYSTLNKLCTKHVYSNSSDSKYCFLKQTRAGDEGPTVFKTCLNCFKMNVSNKGSIF